MNRYIPFIFWLFLTFLVACACACCITLATAKIGTFWAICGIIGSGISGLIFAWQAYAEWLDRNNY